MRCPVCESVTAIRHSQVLKGSQYRQRYCTNLKCKTRFSTQETLIAVLKPKENSNDR